MNVKKLKAVISGMHKGRSFATIAKFTLEPPKRFGDDFTMIVDLPDNSHYVNVRFMDADDLERLARGWIKEHFGNNAKEVRILNERKYDYAEH